MSARRRRKFFSFRSCKITFFHYKIAVSERFPAQKHTKNPKKSASSSRYDHQNFHIFENSKNFLFFLKILIFRKRTSKKPPLVTDPGQTRGGFLMKMPDPQNFPPSGGKSSAKKLIFGRFSTFQVPKIFRPSAEKFSGQTRGGFLWKGGFLTWITPVFEF